MFRGERRHCLGNVFRKTFHRTRNHHKAHNDSDSPVVNKSILREGVFVPIGAEHLIQELPSKKFNLRDPHQPITPGTVHFPIVEKPIYDSFSEGLGGGTSSKSLAEAKRKFKKRGKKSKPARR